MSMRILSVALAVSAVSFAPAPLQQVRQDRADLGRMQGDWKWEANFFTGMVRPSRRVVLNGTTLEMWQCGQKVGKWTIRLDASRSPGAFDGIPLDGGKPLFGIYALVDGQLMLGWADHPGERPETFSRWDGTLSRSEPPPPTISHVRPHPGETHTMIRIPMPPLPPAR
jgi:uncharacterized protein (TIGR03067 family)